MPLPKALVYAEHAVAGVAVLAGLDYVRRNGVWRALGGVVSSALAVVPGAKGAVHAQIEREVDAAVDEMFEEKEEASAVPRMTRIPDEGLPGAEVLRRLATLHRVLDPNPADGRMFAYSYALDGEEEHAGEDWHSPPADGASVTFKDATTRAFCMYMHSNGLNPSAFQSLRRLENEVVAMVADMVNAPASARGTVTTGGTESILMAVKAYRDKARKERGVARPNIVAPRTVHPAFEKAAHYFGVEVRHSAYDAAGSGRADADAAAALCDSNTVALVCSAPQYPHGATDPVEAFAAHARRLGLPLHVDACFGGFLSPWVERLGRPVPLWDFRVDGVTSISLDVHKYGYAPKGSSVVLFLSDEYRKYQMFAYGEWPGGLFVSPSMLGSRNGGTVASAWAALVCMGRDGYMRNARAIMETADYYVEQVGATPGMRLIGTPDIGAVSFTHDEVNVFAVADVMKQRHGWSLELQQGPDSFHCSLMPVHARDKEKFWNDMRDSIQAVRDDPSLAKKGSAAMYGSVGRIPDGGLVTDFLTTFMLKMFSS